MPDFMTLASSGLPEQVRLVGFRGTEALSRPYHFDLYFVAADEGEHALDDAIGAKVKLALDRQDDSAPFVWQGVITSLRLLNQQPGSGLYHAVMAPRLRLLSQTRKSRLFCKQSVTDVIKAVLEDGGLTSSDFELRLVGTYSPEEHICQYQESDLDFIQRWMELEGMYYFFEHDGDAELLVITDDRSAHLSLRDGPVRYHPEFDVDTAARESLATFSCEVQALPASVKLVDRDYSNPALDVSARADVSRVGAGEIVMHNARFFAPGAATRYAKLRAEELLARETTYRAQGTAMKIRSGYLIELEDHPRGAMNRRYLVTEAMHSGSQYRFSPDGQPTDDVYTVSLSAIADDVQFRPRRVTSWPHIYGVEAAVVDGPANNEYAQIDDQGRYAIKMHFDESSLTDGKASTFVRMAQPHGGGIEGFHFPLRKGTEVMVSFLGGDPDRPVITAVAPNALTPSPVTASNHTTNILQTGGRNRLEMEDKSGGQRVTAYSPTEETFLRMGAPNDDVNLYLSTNGNGYIETGKLNVTTVGWKDERVDGTTTETYKGPFKTTVTNAVTETYSQKKTETVHLALTELYKTSQQVTVGGDLKETYKATLNTHVLGPRQEILDAALVEDYKGPLNTTVTNKVAEDFSAAYTLAVTGAQTHSVSGGLTRSILAGLNQDNQGEKWFTMGASAKIICGATSDTTIGGKLELLKAAKIESVLGLKLERTTIKIEMHAANEGGVAAIKVEDFSAGAKIVGSKLKSVASACVKMAGAAKTRMGGMIFKN
jgi:type VI secretion system secreted protein VgrG